MTTLYHTLRDLLGEDLSVAVATIISVKGSVPREVGAKLIIHPYGRHVGTVGGGCGEADVIRCALDVLSDGKPRTVLVDLTEPISPASVGVCGGVMTVYVERWGVMNDPLLEALVAAQDDGRAVALVTAVAADGAFAPLLGTRRLALDDDGDTLQADLVGSLAQGEIEALVAAVQDALQQNEPTLWTHLAPAGRLDCFIEVQSPPRHLIICGAGHIAVPLAAMASTAGFEVTVIDDRAQYANTTRFPAPTRVLAGDFRAELRSLRAGRLHFGRGVCLVLVTRGHQHDVECLLETLDDPLAYVGMIGSRRRIRAVFEMLAQEQGIERARFDHVHAPIGLDIEAHTPAEIAIAILAEIVNTLRGGPALSLRDSTSTVRGRRRNDAARGEGA